MRMKGTNWLSSPYGVQLGSGLPAMTSAGMSSHVMLPKCHSGPSAIIKKKSSASHQNSTRRGAVHKVVSASSSATYPIPTVRSLTGAIWLPIDVYKRQG